LIFGNVKSLGNYFVFLIGLKIWLRNNGGSELRDAETYYGAIAQPPHGPTNYEI